MEQKCAQVSLREVLPFQAFASFTVAASASAPAAAAALAAV